MWYRSLPLSCLLIFSFTCTTCFNFVYHTHQTQSRFLWIPIRCRRRSTAREMRMKKNKGNDEMREWLEQEVKTRESRIRWGRLINGNEVMEAKTKREIGPLLLTYSLCQDAKVTSRQHMQSVKINTRIQEVISCLLFFVAVKCSVLLFSSHTTVMTCVCNLSHCQSVCKWHTLSCSLSRFLVKQAHRFFDLLSSATVLSSVVLELHSWCDNSYEIAYIVHG